MPSAEVSVVVCSHNGEATIARTVRKALVELAVVGSGELIVVDDGSTDRTAERAAAEGARVIRLTPNVGLAAARNAGASAARGELVIFTDDDCEPHPGWIVPLRDALWRDGVDIVGGRVSPGPGTNLLLSYLVARNPLTPLPARLLASNALWYRLLLYVQAGFGPQRELADGTELYSVVGANMGLRRQLIFDLGGFDEAFRFGGEEEDLCRRAHARRGGASIRYVASSVVTHHFADSLGDTLRRSRAYGRGNARAALKHSDSRLILFPFPLAVGVAGALGVCSRRWRLFGAAAAAPLVLYPRWIGGAIRQRMLETLAHPYLQLTQEWLTMVGELEGWRAGYEAIPAQHLRPDGGEEPAPAGERSR